jgi:hypothetical protein
MGLLLEDNGKTWFFLRDGMMRERNAGDGDNLWRTSLAYIAYKNDTLKKGMLDCTEWISDKQVKYYRSTEKTDDDVSRDQVTMFLVAMALNGEDVSKYIKATGWRLSNRYTLTVDMWLWMKALQGNKLARKLFFLAEIPIAKMYQIINKNKILNKHKFPSYALHMLAWQVFSLKSESHQKDILADIILSMADPENYLIRLLAGCEVSREEIETVVPHTDFIWQRYRKESPNLRPLTPEEAEFNTLDVDVLNAVFISSSKREK